MRDCLAFERAADRNVNIRSAKSLSLIGLVFASGGGNDRTYK